MKFIDADDLAWELRTIKSPAEQALLRAAGALGARAMTAAMRSAVVGATEADVLARCASEVIRGGGACYGGGLSSAASAYTFAPTGGHYGAAPNTMRTLDAGDLVRFDIYGSLAGYVFDFASSFVVGQSPRPEQAMLLDAVRDSVRAGIDMLRPGITLGEVARSCESTLSKTAYAQRYGIPASVMGGAWGSRLRPWIRAGLDNRRFRCHCATWHVPGRGTANRSKRCAGVCPRRAIRRQRFDHTQRGRVTHSRSAFLVRRNASPGTTTRRRR